MQDSMMYTMGNKMDKMAEWVKVVQSKKISSYKINKFWGCNVQHGAYS